RSSPGHTRLVRSRFPSAAEYVMATGQTVESVSESPPPAPTLIDTHAHLDEEAFDADRAATVARAEASGIIRIVTIGTTAQTSRRSVEIAREFRAVYAAVGIQ